MGLSAQMPSQTLVDPAGQAGVNVLNLAALLWQPLWCQRSRAANNNNAQVLQLGDKTLHGTNTETQSKGERKAELQAQANTARNTSPKLMTV